MSFMQSIENLWGDKKKGAEDTDGILKEKKAEGFALNPDGSVHIDSAPLPSGEGEKWDDK